MSFFFNQRLRFSIFHNNRDGATDLSGSHSYIYDQLNRLTEANHPAMSSLPVKNENFSYDAVSNRTADAERTGYTYDNANRIISDSSFTYTSDANGNITSKTDQINGQMTSFVYDSASRLVQVDASTYTIATYEYDPTGRRVEKNVGGTVTRYVYDGQDIVAILNGSNNLISLFTHGPGIDSPLIMRRQGTDYMYHCDALGSVGALTDVSANIIETYEYQTFGHTVIKDATTVFHSQSTVENPFMYTSREYDTDSGLYFYRARHYDQVVGRFIQEDPIGFAGGVNFYQYANSNPMLYIDPSGTDIQVVFGPSVLIGGIFPPLTPFVGGSGGFGFTSRGQLIFQGSATGQIGTGFGAFFGLQASVSYSPNDTPAGVSISRDIVMDANIGNGVVSRGISAQYGEGGIGGGSGIVDRWGFGAGLQASGGLKKTTTFATQPLSVYLKPVLKLMSKHEVMCKL